MRLIDTKFGKMLYREMLKVYLLEFKEFPPNCPIEFKQELEKELLCQKKQK